MIDHIDEYHKKWWQYVYKEVFGAVVFIEDCLSECLHWDSGLWSLFEAGAKSVKCISSFESGNVQQPKAVFITRGTRTNLDTIREILLNSHFNSCTFVITVDFNIVTLESEFTYNKLQEAASQWMRSKVALVEIVYAPIFGISVTKNIFVTPVFSTLYPKFGQNLCPAQLSTLDLHSLSSDDKNEVRRLASAINSLFEHVGAKEDIFYLGPFSSILAGVLEHLPAATTRRKSAIGQASVLFIDRTVDICGVTTHTFNSVLDKLMTLLPRFPGHSTDVAVDISPLCNADMITVTDDIHLSPGCTVHAKDEGCRQMFDHFINKSQTEVMYGLYSKLMTMNETSPAKFPPRITAQNLEKLISTHRGNYKLIEANSGILQQSLGIVQALKSPDIQQIELLMCIEQQVLQSITTSRDSTSVLSQISHIIKSWKERELSIERLLSLLVYIYSLAGGYITFSEAQEKTLHEALSNAIFENKDRMSSCFENIEDIHSHERASTLARTIIDKLKNLSKIRDNLIKYKSVIKIVDSIAPSEYRGVLQQLIGDLVDVKRPDIPDLKCRTAGLKDLLKSGLNILMSTASKSAQNISKHPFDNPLVIIYVIGGITAEECFKLHRDIMISGSDVNVIIGSTLFVNPIEAMKQALLMN